MQDYTNHIGQLSVEQQLSIEQEQFRGAFETAAIGMAIVGPDGKWLKMNDSLLNILGYTREELYQLTFQDITHPDDLQNDLVLLKQLLDGTENSYRMEKRYYHKNSQVIWAILSVSIVRDITGRPLHFVSQITDITEIKKITHLRLTETDKQSSRIALELHENIAQSLAGIKMYLNSSLATKMYKDRDLDLVDKQLSEVILQIKQLTANISPTTFLEENLGLVIEDLVLKYHTQYNMQIQVDLDEKLNKMSFYSSYHIYRIVENYLKLAALRSARMLRLHIKYSKTIMIQVEEDGQSSGLLVSSEELLRNDISTRVEILNGGLNTTGG